MRNYWILIYQIALDWTISPPRTNMSIGRLNRPISPSKAPDTDTPVTRIFFWPIADTRKWSVIASLSVKYHPEVQNQLNFQSILNVKLIKWAQSSINLAVNLDMHVHWCFEFNGRSFVSYRPTNRFTWKKLLMSLIQEPVPSHGYCRSSAP